MRNLSYQDKFTKGKELVKKYNEEIKEIDDYARNYLTGSNLEEYDMNMDTFDFYNVTKCN